VDHLDVLLVPLPVLSEEFDDVVQAIREWHCDHEHTGKVEDNHNPLSKKFGAIMRERTLKMLK